MVYTHNLNPIAFSIFNFNIYWYSLAYLIAFIIGGIYAKAIINKINTSFKEKYVDDFLAYAVIGVLLGGRIGYIFFYNFDYYLNYPIESLKIWKGGMSFHGGLLGMTYAMYIFSKKKNILFFDVANIVAVCAPIGLFFGRIANFVNGELIGIATNSNWGIVYNSESPILRHPSQIYEALLEGLFLFFILRFSILNENLRKLHPCSIFLIFYGFFRFLVEFFREPDEQIGYILYMISMGQILCLPMIIFGFIFLKKR